MQWRGSSGTLFVAVSLESTKLVSEVFNLSAQGLCFLIQRGGTGPVGETPAIAPAAAGTDTSSESPAETEESATGGWIVPAALTESASGQWTFAHGACLISSWHGSVSLFQAIRF